MVRNGFNFCATLNAFRVRSAVQFYHLGNENTYRHTKMSLNELTCVREVSSLNLGQDTDRPSFIVICLIPSRLIPAFRLSFIPRPLPSKSFIIYRPSLNITQINIILLLDNTVLLVSGWLSHTLVAKGTILTRFRVLCQVRAVGESLLFLQFTVFCMRYEQNLLSATIFQG